MAQQNAGRIPISAALKNAKFVIKSLRRFLHG